MRRGLSTTFSSMARRIKWRLENWTDQGATVSATVYLVFPAAPGAAHVDSLTECAEVLLERIKGLANKVCGNAVQLLRVDPRTGLIQRFDSDGVVSLSELFSDQPAILVANASFLLTPLPPVVPLLKAAASGALAVCAADSSSSLYAFAMTRAVASQVKVEPVLAQLASYVGAANTQRWADRDNVRLISPSWGCVENSPAMSGLKDQISRPSPIAPIYLNAALAELFYEPADTGPAKTSIERLRQALLAQRERSSVPWIFNLLVNELEYRMGRPILDSFPPEIHLSLTGRCNIECKFCDYTHERAYSDHVSLDRMAQLDVLRYVHTLRLSSGLGEPTVNPHLAPIVEYLSDKFPQLAMNFFTNGIALNRRGLVDALVYNTAWINVSLNAGTPATWQELCKTDLFDRLCSNLKDLHRAKRERPATQPVVYASMVLTSKNIHELPRMPEICRSLGIDRLTGIPFFSLGYDDAAKYGPAETLHSCRATYDQLYGETIREAQNHRVSIEIPMPTDRKQTVFGLETRAFYDFAGIEETPGRLSALIDDTKWTPSEMDNCQHIWRTAYIGSTNRKHGLPNAHYFYPCLGPLARVDFSTRMTFDFPSVQGFREMWNSPVFVKLRAAQHWQGLSKVCDACRRTDSRDPNNFVQMQELLKEWRNGTVSCQ